MRQAAVRKGRRGGEPRGPRAVALLDRAHADLLKFSEPEGSFGKDKPAPVHVVRAAVTLLADAQLARRATGAGRDVVEEMVHFSAFKNAEYWPVSVEESRTALQLADAAEQNAGGAKHGAVRASGALPRGKGRGGAPRGGGMARGRVVCSGDGRGVGAGGRAPVGQCAWGGEEGGEIVKSPPRMGGASI